MKRFYLFEEFYLDTEKRKLFKLDNEEVPLSSGRRRPGKNYDLLLHFVCNANRDLKKSEIISAVWPDVGADDRNLVGRVYQLRRALNDDGERLIQTIQGTGYRFATQVIPSDTAPASAQSVEVVTTEVKKRVKVDSEDWVRKFWTPYLETTRRTMILYTQPLFFRHPTKRLFTRDMNVNESELEKARAKGKERFSSDVISEEMLACRHYTSAGETACLIHLNLFLTENNVRPRNEVSRIKDDWSDDLEDANLILLGNARTNWLIRWMQFESDPKKREGFDFRILRHCIGNKRVFDNERKFYEDLRESETERSNRTVYAILTRMPSRGEGPSVTVLAANNGWAFEKVSEYITSNHHLAKLAKQSGIIDSGKCPDKFQLLFGVDVDEREQPLGEARCLTWRPR